MLGQNDELPAVRALALAYIEALAATDLARMETIFHPQATLSGHFEDGFSVSGVSEGMLDFMKTLPPTAEHSPRFGGRVVSVMQRGTVASAVIEEDQLMDTNFTTLFQMHKIGGDWKITAKATYAHP